MFDIKANKNSMENYLNADYNSPSCELRQALSGHARDGLVVHQHLKEGWDRYLKAITEIDLITEKSNLEEGSADEVKEKARVLYIKWVVACCKTLN